MSTTIDQRVVEMRFDNKQFERGVSDTMSTLEKLKQKLNFKGAVQGVESVNSAARNVQSNMGGLSSSVEAVSMKFSALQVMGVTALANITNSAVNAGKRIVSALTIDPVRTGFSEYETQINAVQTILANTSHAGTTIQDVNKALDDLNKYADQTIYNFTEMTRNIGTFTAAGVDLETSTSAIKGIANLAAVSGSTSQQASTAMYQLSQALAAGRVSLMDWNSVVNAGMGGKVFQDALTRTADVMNDGAASKAIEKYGSFRESLTKGEWLSTDVLTETLNQFTMAAKEGSDEWNKFKESLKEKGYTEEQAVEILKMANTATDAATKVKTFTQLWDVLKESAQSGWSQTWKLIIGDFEDAKALLTPLADFLTNLINRTSDFRNRILKVGLHFSEPWAAITDKLGNVKKVIDSVKNVTDSLEYFQDVVNKVWRGDYNNYGDNPDRRDLLKAAGYDPRVVQDLVNKGYQYKLTIEDIQKSHEKFGLTLETTAEETEEAADAFNDLTDEKLKDAGLTEDEIALYHALEKEASRLGISVGELADKMSKTSGRTLLIESFKNIGDVFVGLGKAAKEAWINVFNPPSAETLGVRLYGMLESLRQFTETLRLTDKETGKLTENGEKIRRTLGGVFAIIDVITTIVGGGFKIAFKIVSELLSRFDLNILDVTAAIGDALVGFRDFIDSILNVSGIVDFLVPLVKNLARYIVDLVNAVKNSKWFGDFCNYLNTAADGISNLFKSIPNMSGFQKLVGTLEKAKSVFQDWLQVLKDSDNIPRDIIAGLVNGITNGIPAVISAVFELARNIISGICSVLGIHSPSTAMITIGGFIIAGLIKGILDGETSVTGAVDSIATVVWDTVKQGFEFIKNSLSGAFKGLWDFISNENGHVDWGKILAGGMLGTLLWVLVQFANAFKGITDSIGGIGDIFEEAGDVLKKFGNVLTGYSWDLKAKALQKLAIAVAILVGAVVVLAQIDDIGKLWNAVGIIAVLSGVLVGLAIAMDKFASMDISIKEGKINGLKTGLMQIALAIGILAFVVKMIGDMEDPAQGFKGLIGITVGLIVFMAALGGISIYAKDLGQFGSVMLKLSIAMALMVMVIKMIDGLDNSEIGKGILFAAGFSLFVIAITRVAKSAGNNVSKVGGLMIKLSIAMGLMVGVCKLISLLDAEDAVKGTIFAAGFAIFLKALINCTKIGKKQQIAKLGGLIMAVSTSMMLMVGVCKLAGMLKVSEMIKGALFAAGFTLLIKAMVGILSIGSETQMAKVTGTILAMAVAIGILAAVSVALGYVDLGSLAKGVAAVSILGLVMAAMVKSLRGANDVKGSIMMMAIAIGVMAAAIAALTFIDEPGALEKATASLAIVMGMFALITKYAGHMEKSIGAIAVMTVAVGLLAGVLYLLANNIDDANAAVKTAVALGILMTAMAACLKIVAKVGPTAMAAMPAMGVMLLIAAGLGVILGILDALDVKPSIETAASLSILLLAMVGVTAILAMIGPAAGFAMAGVVAFAAVVAGIGLLMVALGALNEHVPSLQKWLDSGIGVLQKIGEGIGRFIGGFIGGIGEGMMDSLNDMVDTFGEIVEKLVGISDVGTGIKTEGFDGIKKLLEVIGSIGLSTVGTTFADIFTLGGTSMEKFQSDGVAFFNAMKAIGEASTGVTIDESGFDTVVSAAQKLADLQNSLEPIGGVIEWFKGKSDLATFATNVGEFIGSIKLAFGGLAGFAFNSGAVDSIVTACTGLAKLQSSLEPIGGVITWFKGRDDLATFGVNVGEFISSIKLAFGSLTGFSLNTEALTGIIDASKSLAKLQSSLEPIGGVISWFAGRDDLGTFGANVALFINSMKTALGTLNGTTLNEEALNTVITAAKDLAKLQDKLEPIGGVVSWFAGRTDLGTFGTNIQTFASAMGTLKTEMGEDGITENVVASITNAGNAIIELHKALPEEGWFDGKMNLSDFSGYVTEFGEAMGKFAESASQIDATAVNTSITTAHRIKSLIESLVGLDTSGLASFTGIGTGGFGADGAAYKIAQAISKYSEEVAGIDTSAVTTSVSAASKLKSLIAGLVGLDTSGIENFKPGTIGSAMKSYADKVSGIDATIVSSSITSANRLKNLITSLVGLDTSGIHNFRPQSIGDALKSYGSSVAGMDTGAVNKSVSSASKLKLFISGLAGLNTSGVGSFKKALSDLSTIEVDKIVKAFSGAGPKLNSAGSKMMDGLVKGVSSKTANVKMVITKVITSILTELQSKLDAFNKVGANLASKLAAGMASKKNAVRSAMQSCVATATSGTAAYYTSFYNAGSYLVSGFANGISANSYRAVAKAKAMANAAEKAAREALGINSPSRVFKEIGSGIPEGFAMGIEKMSGLIRGPLDGMANSAIKSVSDTVARLATAIDSDMDVQPTIRPVLDLSDIRSGAGAISGMLGVGSSVGVLANVNSISRSMNARGQNVSNADVVSAIERLDKHLDNVGNTTYTIGGITYDDGSNIATAVRDLTRYARMERRR